VFFDSILSLTSCSPCLAKFSGICFAVLQVTVVAVVDMEVDTTTAVVAMGTVEAMKTEDEAAVIKVAEVSCFWNRLFDSFVFVAKLMKTHMVSGYGGGYDDRGGYGGGGSGGYDRY
jgi:hypothetical protein